MKVFEWSSTFYKKPMALFWIIEHHSASSSSSAEFLLFYFMVSSLTNIGGLYSEWCGWLLNTLSPSHTHRGGLPRGTRPRFLPETARLRGVPNRGEGLPPRVSGQLPGGRRRSGHLLHPPPQQAQEIYLPVHWWLLFRPGSGESGQMWLYKVFLIEKEKIFKRQHPQQLHPPSCLPYFICLPDPTHQPFFTLKEAKEEKEQN